ncbi:hypothetical protein P171DRAFT_434547 [Karstenula rhodostoma CBS 690.94]|uniref:SAP domain-containing protein n=1 Tax=Karstenula rhodostoma CBS 690.94 TaxID=1392251 RepID=A0A9P4PBH2_9PLEO|nr:hypothetical protein P171DRAFT_434547 [Karstenula rhodostoma CBS 690.94]
MQAARVSSRAFKAVAAGSKQSRSLHMTGPATYSNLLTSERPAMNHPQSLAGLRYECQVLKLSTTGTKEELRSRLSAHELTNGARTFSSTAVDNSKRPLVGAPVTGHAFRHFNTSRELKSPNDSSTIDFAFVPDFDPDLGAAPVAIRVPILPTTTTPNPSYAFASPVEVDEEYSARVPRIHTVSSHHVHAPAAMSEVHDNNTIDFQGMAFEAVNKLKRPVEEGASMAKQIWGGLVDDVLGPKGKPA